MDHLVTVMNEAWRVLQPGGQFEIVCPTLHETYVWRVFADPTHRRVIVPQTWLYFSRPASHIPSHPDYNDKVKQPWDWNWYGSDYGIQCRFDCELMEVEMDVYVLLRKPLDGV
jgi:hypothetical protein